MSNPKEQSPFWKPVGHQMLKEIPVLYGTTKLITKMTTAGHLSLLSKRKTETPFKFSYFLKTHFNITLPPTHIFRSRIIPSDWLIKKCKFLSIPPHTIYPPHLIKFDLMSIIWRRRQIFPPLSYLLARKQHDISLLPIRWCSNVNRLFNFPIQGSYVFLMVFTTINGHFPY